MARAETVRIEGLAELNRALRELPQRIANRGLRTAVYAGAKVIRDEARHRAPKAAQSLGTKQPSAGTLKRSVIMKHIRELSGGGRQTFYVIGPPGQEVPQSRQAREPLARRLVLALCGVRHTQDGCSDPFLRPALESRRREAVEAIKGRFGTAPRDRGQEASKGR